MRRAIRRAGLWLHYQWFLYCLCRGWSSGCVQAAWKLVGFKLGYRQLLFPSWRWGPKDPIEVDFRAPYQGHSRLRTFQVSGCLLLWLGQGSFRVTHDPLPEDVLILAGVWEDATQLFTLLLTSEAFAELPEGATVPPVDSPHIAAIRAAADVADCCN
jgi:hypothetical protein